MQLRTKRIVSGVVVLVGVGAIGVATLIGAVSGDAERVALLQVRTSIGTDGNAQVSEAIDYDFGAASSDKHGIYRTVPGLTSDAGITVRSADAPDQFQLLDDAGRTKIKIGDPDQTVSGRHRYDIDYRLGGLAPGRKLAFDAVGTEWEVPIREATIDIALPWVATDVRCNVGKTNATGGCEATQAQPGHLRVTVKDLGKGKGITLYATAGDDLASTPALGRFAPEPADDSPALATPVLVALAAAAVGAVGALVLVRRGGREWIAAGGATDAAFAPSPGGSGSDFSELPPPPGKTAADQTWTPTSLPAGAQRVDASELVGLATTAFTPPPGLAASQGSIVLQEGVTDDTKSAWLIEQTMAGSVAFDESTGTKQLLRNPDPNAPLPPVLAKAFGARTAISLGAYDAEFAAAWSDLSTQLEGWRKSSGLWDPTGDRRRTQALGFGLLAAVPAVIVAGIAAHFGLLPLVVLLALVAGAGIAAAVTCWELAVRTPAGSAAWLQVESFRRFLHESEVQHVDWAVEHGVLRDYTAWAVAVGEIDRWNKALNRSTVAPQADPNAFAYAAMAYSFSSATHTASTAPSSSGGGGGVGGGGGGGGGGSW